MINWKNFLQFVVFVFIFVSYYLLPVRDFSKTLMFVVQALCLVTHYRGNPFIILNYDEASREYGATKNVPYNFFRASTCTLQVAFFFW